MLITVRRCGDLDLIAALEKGNSERTDEWHPIDASAWWVARDGRGRVLGYASARYGYPPRTGTLAWARVLPAARGHGVQRRLIRARLAWLRKRGCTVALTYTAAWNAASMDNLIACGFRPYFGGKDEWVRWRREL